MAYHDLTETTRMSPPVDTSLPYDASHLAGKTILITGGALGLGANFARHWASHGANLMIGDINAEAGQQLVAELRTQYPKAAHHFFDCDVTDWDSQVAFFKAAASASPHGGIDIVVANAGINDPKANRHFENPKAVDSDPDAPCKPNTKTIDVNITGALHTTHLAMFWLPRNGFDADTDTVTRAGPGRDRCLLLLGSYAGVWHLAAQAYYTTSKHAITGLFRALRGTAWKQGIRITMICPYFVSGSNMFPSAAEAAFLAGTAGAATHADVLDAGTRLIADETIVGRALLVGPKIAIDGDEVESSEKRDERAVWDCYAEDYTESEAFVWRWVRAMNAVEKRRGWLGVFWDILRFATGGSKKKTT
ncbi:hypothetical protein FDECE_648 [Fusarium decemcellulare]|nr:hypothetical protein FDECE_648 [Fusarium decemcellulare]